MADYSGYTIKRPHSLAPLSSVYEAAAADGRPGRFALKVFHPPASTNARRLYAIEGWLLAAERQQQEAKKDGAVLEVLAFGRCEEGAFAVLPWQERSLEPWIKTLGAKGDTLRALTECLLNTVEKWEAQTGRPHGNLKASNIYLDRSGPLVGMTAKFSDAAFMPGARIEALRLADFSAIGAILAQIVRRRPPGAWPIEEAPEWKALGPGGKGWLDFCNYLLNPQPGEGEVTLAKARLRLRKVPKDANPVKTAALTLAAVAALGMIGLVAFARFGNPLYMPEQVFRLAQTLKNPQIKPEVPPAWIALCGAWDTWLIDLQSNGPRLLKTEGLWEPDDQLRKELTDFVAKSNELLPATLVPEAASEKRLGVLANSPPIAVLNELQTQSAKDRIAEAGRRLTRLSTALDRWPRWNQLRTLQKLMADREYKDIAAALLMRLPPQRLPGEKLDLARTLKFFNDLSLDNTGTLLLASRWSEISKHTKDMVESGDRIQQLMPQYILTPLTDRSSIGDFADSLGKPLDEMRLRRKQFLDPQVVQKRFLAESPLLKEEITELKDTDFERWVNELREFSLVPAADDPRLSPEIDATSTRLTQEEPKLEPDAPQPDPGGLATLSREDFQREFTALTAALKSLRDRPIVRRDLPDIAVETTKMAGAFTELENRQKVTIELLNPEIWLPKVAGAYGKFNESKQRWAAWQATIANVTPAMLAADRPRFRVLRQQERDMKEWIDGLEGPTGFGALSIPDLASTASGETSAELLRLEAVRREQQAVAVGGATAWNGALPTAWASASPAMKQPLEEHRAWLAALPEFATNLDRLRELLEDGFIWDETGGVSEVMGRLRTYAGLEDLTGRPGEWNAEAKQLEQLVNASDRGVLVAAAQSGGLSRKLMAWRKLGALTAWPAGPADFDIDGGVIKAMRERIGSDVKNETRRANLLEELGTGVRLRFNRATRNATQVADTAEAQLTAMFERMPAAGLTEKDLDAPVAYNLALWRLKHDDWNETNLERLRIRRDLFVRSVQDIPDESIQRGAGAFVTEIRGIELKDDPNRVPTPSPRMKGWTEEPTNEGLGLTATWSSGTKKVKLDYSVVQPTDGTPAFFLAVREIAVGEFVDLLSATTPGPEGKPIPTVPVKAVMDTLPQWAQLDARTSFDKPYDKPVSWRPKEDGKAYEVNPSWIYKPTSQVAGLLADDQLRATTPALDQAMTENPTPRTPLQMIPPETAKIFAEQVLGARLPKPEEWRAVTTLYGKNTDGFFRGSSFQRLWKYLEEYRVAGQVMPWRPNEGIFLPVAQVADSKVKRKYVDDGSVGSGADQGKLWFASVDEGPSTNGFINLYGNVWVYLCDDSDAAKPAYYVAGGSILSPPGVDVVEPHKVEAVGLIGATKVREGFADVGIRPAFYAPPGFKERYKLFVLVRDQKYLAL